MVRTRAFLKLLLFAGVSLLPIYLYGSGSLQPTHAILLVFSLSTMLAYGFTPERWNVTVLALAGYAVLIETAYVLGGARVTSLMNASYFVFNFFLGYGVWQFCRINGLEMLARGLIVAAVLGLFSVGFLGVQIVEGPAGMRETGGFNNPNQLGYFSVCLLSLAYILNRRGNYNQLTTYFLYAVAIFLAISSLSKAAMVATFAVLFLATNPRLQREFILPWVLAILIGSSVLIYMSSTGALDNYLFAQRLQGMTDEGDSSLESRGYFAFLEADIVSIVLGLGGSQVEKILDHEVHSTVASVFNVYGFVGGILFSTVLFLWAKRVYLNYGMMGVLCIFVPAMLYGITHNGSRFTIFWLLIAVSMLPFDKRAAVTKSSPPPAPERPVVFRRAGSPPARPAFGPQAGVQARSQAGSQAMMTRSGKR